MKKIVGFISRTLLNLALLWWVFCETNAYSVVICLGLFTIGEEIANHSYSLMRNVQKQQAYALEKVAKTLAKLF